MKIFKSNSNENGYDPFVIREGRIKNSNLGSANRLGWTEESFSMDRGNKETIGRTFDFDFINKIYVFLFLFIVLIFSRIGWLQVVKGDYYYKIAEGNRIRVERIEANRGIIYDRNMKPLVRNKANFMLYFTPSDLPKDSLAQDATINQISEILGTITLKEENFSNKEQLQNEVLNSSQIAEYIKNKLSKIKRGSPESFVPLFITDNIDYDKAILLDLESANWQGVVLSNKVQREYLLSADSLSHVLGYTGKINDKELKKAGNEYQPIDFIGKNGVESFWENELRGTNGKKQIEVDAFGKEKKIINYTPPVDGSNLVLSIDVDLQNKIEQVVKDTLTKFKLAKASVVALDPNNGEVLALVNFPSYDDNIFARGITQSEYNKYLNDPNLPLFNRAISGEYPSGSVIKPIMAAAALQEGVITENTTFLSTGGLKINQWFFPDWKAGGHGITDVKKALADSVNTFFYIIGGGYQDFVGLGVDRIIKYEKSFGLGVQTGIDLPGESTGFLPSKDWKEKTKGEKWYIGDTYHLSIGQGDLTVTPLQVAEYTTYFANGGKMYQPHVVKEILTGDEKQSRSIDPNLTRENIVSDYNLNIVREGMRQTITQGVAKSLQSVPVAVAGKTGTAQWSTKKAPQAWFTGFAPYDKPTIVLSILVEEGKEGSTVAVPIAKDVLTWYFSQSIHNAAATTTVTSQK